VKISSERKRERERERENGRTRGKTSRREMEINAQPARGNSNEIRIFERYPAITFDVQFNELIRAIGRQLIAFELLLFIANILINHGR